MQKIFKEQKHYLFYIFLIAFTSLFVTFINLGFKKNFIGEDSGVSFDFPRPLRDLTYYMWDTHRAPGKANVSTIFNFIWNNIILLFSSVGFSGFTIKRILYFLFFFLSGFGAFNLSRFFLLNHYKNNYRSLLFSAFVAGLIYMFNPYSAQLASFPIINYHSSYIFFPWVFLMFIYNLNKPPKFSNIFIFSLLVVVAISANPSNTAVIILFIFFYGLFFLRDYLKNWNYNLSFLISSGILILLLSAFIILPTLKTETNIYGIEKIDIQDFLGSIRLHSTFTSFFNLFRLIGSRDWPTFPYSPTYDRNYLFLLISFLLPITALVALLYKTARKEKSFLLFTLIFFLFASKGIREPLSDLFLSLFKTYPILGMFRAVYFKFMFPVVLSISLLISFSLMEFQKKENFTKHRVLYRTLIIVLLLVNNFPFFTGLVPKSVYLNNIPAEYQSLENFFAHKPEGSILSLPETPNGAGPIMHWNKDLYIGPPTDFFFTNRPTLDGHWFIVQKYLNLTEFPWDSTTLAENVPQLTKLSGILNIKYFLIHKDYLKKYEFTTSNGEVLLNGPLKSEIITKKFKENPNLRLIYSSDKYDIYERTFLQDWGKFYVPQEVVVDNNVKQKLFTYPYPFNQSFAIVNSLDSNQIRSLNTNLVNVEYTKKNPTYYEVNLKNADYPLLLVFSESYHPQWKLTNKNGATVPEINHLKINDYANAWIINEGTEFKLEFLPQKYFNIGLIISSLTFFLSIIILIYKIPYQKK